MAEESESVSETKPSLLELRDTKHHDQIEYARIAYELAVQAYNAENDQQQHFWQRFRDAVQLMFVIAAGLAATTLKLSQLPSSSVIVLIVIVELGGLVSLVAAGWQLHAVFEGMPYLRLDPADLQNSFHKRTQHFSNRTPGRLLPIRGTRALKGGGKLETAIVGTVIEDAAAMLLEAAAENHKINFERSKTLRLARDWLVVGLATMLVCWVASAVLLLTSASRSASITTTSEPLSVE
jgi:hypothetical protein